MVLLLQLLAAAAAAAAALNDRPVIGVLAQPADAEFGGPAASYIVASYIKWVEAAGARAAPILWNSTRAELSAAFAQVNGLLMPGGHCGIHAAYGNATWHLLDLARAANDAGSPFAVWGTCQGHEQLAQYATGANAPSALRPTAGTEGLIVPLNLTGVAAPGRGSRLLANASEEVLTSLATRRITINLHSYSAYAADVERAGSASHAFLRVLGTDVDAHGVEFASLMEGGYS